MDFLHTGLKYWRWFAWHVEVGQRLISNLHWMHKEGLCSVPLQLWASGQHMTFPKTPAPRPFGSTEQTAPYTEGSGWHVHLCTWPWDSKPQGNHVKCSAGGGCGEGSQMGYTTHWKKMGLGIQWALWYHIKQFVAVRIGVLKRLGTEWMLCWKWMEKSGLVSSCCESCCETPYEMLLWQVQSIGHHYQLFR